MNTTEIDENGLQVFSTHVHKNEYAVEMFEYEDGIQKFLPVRRTVNKIYGMNAEEPVLSYSPWTKIKSLQNSHNEAVQIINNYKATFKTPVSSKIITIE